MKEESDLTLEPPKLSSTTRLDDEREGPKWSRVHAATLGLKVVLLILLGIDFLVSVAAAGIRAVDLSGDGTDGGVDTTIVWTQVGLEISEAVLSLAAIGVLVARFGEKTSQRLGVVALIKIVCIFFSVAYLAYPQVGTVIVALVALLLRIAELLAIAWISWKVARFADAELPLPPPLESQVVGQDAALPKGVRTFLRAAESWADLAVARANLHRKYANGRTLFFLFGLLVLGVLVINAGVQFKFLITTQATVLKEAAIRGLTADSPLDFGANVTARSKVVVVVLDGLRNDYLDLNPSLRSFVTDSAIGPDLAVLRMAAQLPSMSVPNWLTIVTGARPESTGVLGNLLVPETPFDSIFHQAKLRRMNRGLTGSPWFADIVSSQLPWFKGDGTIPTNIDPTRHHSADAADNDRWLVTKQALGDTADPYQLFLVHFSDIDVQGHAFGVDKRWNKLDTYNGAVTNKTILVRKIIEAVDDSTTVVIASDHGQVLRGGHGGIDPSLLEVPLMIYRRGSGLASKTFKHPGFRANSQKENIDIAPSVCALLGVPVPRTSEGVFIDEALILVAEPDLMIHYRDLFSAKRAFVVEFLAAVGASADVPVDPFAGRPLPKDVNDTALRQFVEAIAKLDEIYAKKRDVTILLQQARNIGCSALALAAYVVCALVIMSKAMFCAPMFWKQETGDDISWRSMNRRALFGSLCMVCLYVAFSMLIYFLIYLAVGYSIWDSTVIHTPEVVPSWLLIVIVPAVVMSVAATLAYHAFTARNLVHAPWLPTRIRERLAANLLAAPKGDALADPARRYLWRAYTLFWLVAAAGIILVLQGAFQFTVPGVFAVRFVTRVTWAMRFRVVTVQMMIVPMFVCALSALYLPCTWSRRNSVDRLDSVYLLHIFGSRVHKKKSSITQPLLEEKPQQAKSYDDLLVSMYGTPLSMVKAYRRVVSVARSTTTVAFELE